MWKRIIEYLISKAGAQPTRSFLYKFRNDDRGAYFNDCGEVCIKDLGLIGSPRGWNIMVGGNGGSKPRLSVRLIEDVPTNEEALALIDRIMQWFKGKNVRARMGKYMEEVGFEAFREEVMAAIKA